MSAQQSGKGDFDMEQEVTVKTRLKGRGTFSGNTSGSMQDSLNASHVIGSDGIPNRSNSYPSSLPPPFDPRLLHQQDMYGRVGGMQGSAPQGMGGYPHTSHMGMGRASTSF